MTVQEEIKPKNFLMDVSHVVAFQFHDMEIINEVGKKSVKKIIGLDDLNFIDRVPNLEWKECFFGGIDFLKMFMQMGSKCFENFDDMVFRVYADPEKQLPLRIDVMDKLEPNKPLLTFYQAPRVKS